MASYNRVTLVGNITRDVELRYTQSGMAVTDLGLAVNERVKQGNDWIDKPVFCDCTAWGKTAEIAQEYLGKGKPVLIEGRLQLDQWEQDGQKRSKLKVVVDRLVLLGSRDPGGNGAPAARQTAGSGAPAGSDSFNYGAEPEGDVPF